VLSPALEGQCSFIKLSARKDLMRLLTDVDRMRNASRSVRTNKAFKRIAAPSKYCPSDAASSTIARDPCALPVLHCRKPRRATPRRSPKRMGGCISPGSARACTIRWSGRQAESERARSGLCRFGAVDPARRRACLGLAGRRE
jgi:hypothetical protein